MITIEQLAKIMPNSTAKSRSLFVEPLNDAMKEFDITTPVRMAMFLAQIAHESGNLRYVEELASGSAYEFRDDLGNLKHEALEAAHYAGSTTGRFYRGHGLIQITGYDNHLACGKALGIDLINHPDLLTKPINAARSAAWFWKENGLNQLADSGNFGKITRIINGGTNGAKERLAFYGAAKRVLA